MGVSGWKKVEADTQLSEQICKLINKSPQLPAWKPLHQLSTMQHPPQVPWQAARCSLTYSLLCSPGLYSLAAAFQSIAHGRSGRLAQQVQAFSAEAKKQASSKRSFVSFQIYPRFFKACYLPPFVLQSRVVVVTNASGLRIDSRMYVFIQSNVMSCCNKTSLLKTHPQAFLRKE